MQWLIRFQTVTTLASGTIYPYYLLFLKNLGNSYSKYGLAFAVFTVSSAAVSHWLGARIDQRGKALLALSSLGMMSAMLVFPWTESYLAVLGLQLLMGVCNAMARMSERVLLADLTRQGQRGPQMASFHFWTTAGSGFAVLHGGVLIDWLTIDVLFYASALLYGISALCAYKKI